MGVCMPMEAEVCVGCLPQLLYTICLDTGSLTDLKPSDFGRLGDQPGIPCLHLPSAEFLACTIMTVFLSAGH